MITRVCSDSLAVAPAHPDAYQLEKLTSVAGEQRDVVERSLVKDRLIPGDADLESLRQPVDPMARTLDLLFAFEHRHARFDRGVPGTFRSTFEVLGLGRQL